MRLTWKSRNRMTHWRSSGQQLRKEMKWRKKKILKNIRVRENNIDASFPSIFPLVQLWNTFKNYLTYLFFFHCIETRRWHFFFRLHKKNRKYCLYIYNFNYLCVWMNKNWWTDAAVINFQVHPDFYGLHPLK